MMYTRDFGRLRIADLEGGIDERLQKPNQNFSSKKLAAWHVKVSAKARLANTRISKFLASPSLPLGLFGCRGAKTRPQQSPWQARKLVGIFLANLKGVITIPLPMVSVLHARMTLIPDPCPTKLVELKIIPIWWEKYQTNIQIRVEKIS